MIHDKVYLNSNKTAYVEVYALDSDISYQVYKKRPAMIICLVKKLNISAQSKNSLVKEIERQLPLLL